MPDLLQTIASSSTPRNALNVLLRLAIVTPDAERAQSAVAAADELAQRLPPNDVRELLAEIKQDADQFVRVALRRLADSECDSAKRMQYEQIIDVFAVFAD